MAHAHAPRLGTETNLTAKKRPAQRRASATYETILETAARLLGEVGIDRLSTNLVCEHAGLTPPALYRYFPNKYALLNELGQRLMQRQNELVPRWINARVLGGSQSELERALAGLLLDTYRVTRKTPGGVWIMRALRAVPALEQVRLESHTQVTREQARLLAEAFPDVAAKDLMLIARIAVDMIYAAVEMLLDVRLDSRKVAEIVAAMIASQLGRVSAISTPPRDPA